MRRNSLNPEDQSRSRWWHAGNCGQLVWVDFHSQSRGIEPGISPFSEGILSPGVIQDGVSRLLTGLIESNAAARLRPLPGCCQTVRHARPSGSSDASPAYSPGIFGEERRECLPGELHHRRALLRTCFGIGHGHLPGWSAGGIPRVVPAPGKRQGSTAPSPGRRQYGRHSSSRKTRDAFIIVWQGTSPRRPVRASSLSMLS